MNEPQHYYLEELLHDDGVKWKIILDYALPNPDEVEFAVGKDERIWRRQLQPIMSAFLRKYTSRWRWQCNQRSTTTFVRFKATSEVQTFLRSIPRLTDWMVELPEDPAIYADGTALMWTISHEGYAWLLLTDSERTRLQARGLTLAVQAENRPPTQAE